ncbi:winged helix-turn-helix transcriptional regulator [Flagellimonas allohymeniacidonis]|uniref:Transcriptional regulator n=1 Tax=Flagellimonas allohymeniacidonis TaxID=2517819 RepID=A0A4Q8QDM6_9FLAO|nr:helix-turn-helix domain-containing protein [Allomuricauda hymeniacidonis]TAI48505.1 transcriptional regulator [Allomuricauda hymeniacidonis]
MRKSNSSNSINEKSILEDCPITSTWLAIGGRWKLVIIWQLRDSPMRYNMLFRAIPNISQKMLTQQLKSLVEEGWVYKTDFKEIPPRTEYKLSKLGLSFLPILRKIYDWGKENDIAAKYSVGPFKEEPRTKHR